MRARWGCGGPPKWGKAEHAVASSIEKTLRLPEGTCAGSCPFAGIYDPAATGGHLGELLDARLLVADEHVTWREALGRDLTWVDVEALRARKLAAARLDAARERQREAETKGKA